MQMLFYKSNRYYAFTLNYIILSPSNLNKINRYYILQRKSEDRNVASTTVRMFESILRLSQGI